MAKSNPRHAEIQTGSGCLAPVPGDRNVFVYLRSRLRMRNAPDTKRVSCMKPALLMLIFVTAGRPVLAKPYHAYQNSGQAARSEASHISRDTVRAYVGQVGLVQAKALARAAGMTASQEQRARRCLAKKD
jgi:hypothetical protein